MSDLFQTIAVVTPPSGICSKCAEQAMEHTPTASVFAFCRHTEVGAMHIQGGGWRLFEGFTAQEFKSFVLHLVLEAEARYLERQTGGMTRQ